MAMLQVVGGVSHARANEQASPARTGAYSALHNSSRACRGRLRLLAVAQETGGVCPRELL